jgi:hypothetical protein
MDTAPFRCRGCGHEQTPTNAAVRARLEASGLCQGCRAARTFGSRPWLLPAFVRAWERVGFPASDSWLGDLSAEAHELKHIH